MHRVTVPTPVYRLVDVGVYKCFVQSDVSHFSTTARPVLHKGRTYLRRHTATQILIKTAAA